MVNKDGPLPKSLNKHNRVIKTKQLSKTYFQEVKFVASSVDSFHLRNNSWQGNILSRIFPHHLKKWKHHHYNTPIFWCINLYVWKLYLQTANGEKSKLWDFFFNPRRSANFLKTVLPGKDYAILIILRGQKVVQSWRLRQIELMELLHLLSEPIASK